VARDLLDTRFVAERTTGWEGLRAVIERYPPSAVRP